MATRWCPTPEQLMILEEMYKGGLRTPNASQIQKITSHLSFYGIIEGKNVFYWFQNHKARDRQRLRRKLSKQILQDQHYYSHHFNAFTSINQPPPSSSSCFDHLHQPSHHKSSAEYLHQGDDDWMMMMGLRKACGTSHCCRNRNSNSNSNRPLKTLQLFPIKATSIKEEEEEQQQRSTTENQFPSSVMLRINSSMYK